MTFDEAVKLANSLNEERSGNDFLDFKIQLGENEGDNIPHFHLDNFEIGKKQKKTAIRIDIPYYFIHGDKKYILNSSEKKDLLIWLIQEPKNIAKGNTDENGKPPKTNWENLRNMWNNYYPQAKIKGAMPNYVILSKDYKEAIKEKEMEERILRKRIGLGKMKKK